MASLTDQEAAMVIEQQHDEIEDLQMQIKEAEDTIAMVRHIMKSKLSNGHLI